MTTAAREPLRRRLRRRVPRPRPLVVVCLVLVLGLLGGGYVWFRGSSFVSVRHVTVTGLHGADAGQIRQALIASADGMTTLDVNVGSLHSAVQPFPDVRSLTVSTSFPHTLRIRVIEQQPVAIVVAAGHRIAVAGDGTLLRTLPSNPLPTITLAVSPGGTHVSGAALQEARLAAAAPARLLGRVVSITTSPVHGLVATLHDGPQLYFGSASQLSAKWASAVLALASVSSAGAAYIDVSAPNRPAAGSGSDGGSAASGATTATAQATTAATSGDGAGTTADGTGTTAEGTVTDAESNSGTATETSGDTGTTTNP